MEFWSIFKRGWGGPKIFKSNDNITKSFQVHWFGYIIIRIQPPSHLATHPLDQKISFSRLILGLVHTFCYLLNLIIVKNVLLNYLYSLGYVGRFPSEADAALLKLNRKYPQFLEVLYEESSSPDESFLKNLQETEEFFRNLQWSNASCHWLSFYWSLWIKILNGCLQKIF